MVDSQTDVVIAPSTPFAVTAIETNVAGYALTFCYECTVSPVGGGSSIVFTKDSITVNSVSQLSIDCSSSLFDSGFSPFPISYNSAGSFEIVAQDYTVLFTHS